MMTESWLLSLKDSATASQKLNLKRPMLPPPPPPPPPPFFFSYWEIFGFLSVRWWCWCCWFSLRKPLPKRPVFDGCQKTSEEKPETARVKSAENLNRILFAPPLHRTRFDVMAAKKEKWKKHPAFCLVIMQKKMHKESHKDSLEFARVFRKKFQRISLNFEQKKKKKNLRNVFFER